MLPRKSRRLRTWFISLIVLSLAIVGAGAFLIKPNAYREHVQKILSDKLEREVILGGDLVWGLSLTEGLKFDVKNVSVANEKWAKDPSLATIGRFSLGVRLMPLLQKRLEVTSFALEKVNVFLEEGSNGKGNWDFSYLEAKPTEDKVSDAPKEKQESRAVKISFESFKIDNLKVSMRYKNGQRQEFFLSDLTFHNKEAATFLKLKAKLDNRLLTLTLKGGDLNDLQTNKWSFDVKGFLGTLAFDAKGDLFYPSKKLHLTSYKLELDLSKLKGDLFINWGGSRPKITARAMSETLDSLNIKEAQVKITPQEQRTARKQIFSRDPLPFDLLKSMDGELSLSFDEVVFSQFPASALNAYVVVKNGVLTVSPFNFVLADSKVEAVLKIDVTKPIPEIKSIIKAHQLNLPKFVHIGGVESFLIGKGDVDLDIQTKGNSLHDLASNVDGSLNLVMAGGTLSEHVLGKLGKLFLEALAPGTGKLAEPGVNCMVAKFAFEDGMAQAKGLLLDTNQATAFATGFIDLKEETINLDVQSKAKALNLQGIVPPLAIKGSLLDPKFRVNAGESLKKIADLFMGKALGSNDVPEIIAKEGRNACVYTLEQTGQKTEKAIKKATEKAIDKSEDLKAIGKELLKNIFKK